MTADLRSRIGAAIAHQHAEGALVDAEVDAVMDVLKAEARQGTLYEAVIGRVVMGLQPREGTVT